MDLTSRERNSALRTIVLWKAPGQNLLGNSKCLNSWLCMNLRAQFTGKGALRSSRSGKAGSISNRISSSLRWHKYSESYSFCKLRMNENLAKTYGGVSGLATTEVGTTSMWGIKIFPVFMALRMDRKNEVLERKKIIQDRCSPCNVLNNVLLQNSAPFRPVGPNSH